jgi:hypothetical protein
MKFISILIIIFLIFACEKEGSGEVEEMKQTAIEKGSGELSTLPELTADYLTSVYELQELIKMEENSLDLRKNYCDHSYLKKDNLFLSMGIGRMSDPKDGRKIAQYLVEKAALNDAIRWACYGEKWLKENYQPPFGKLETYFNRNYQIIDRAVVGDSLFLFIATNMELN